MCLSSVWPAVYVWCMWVLTGNLQPHYWLDLGSGTAAASFLSGSLINMIYFPLKEAILEKLDSLRDNSSKGILFAVLWTLRTCPQQFLEVQNTPPIKILALKNNSYNNNIPIYLVE